MTYLILQWQHTRRTPFLFFVTLHLIADRHFILPDRPTRSRDHSIPRRRPCRPTCGSRRHGPVRGRLRTLRHAGSFLSPEPGPLVVPEYDQREMACRMEEEERHGRAGNAVVRGYREEPRAEELYMSNDITWVGEKSSDVGCEMVRRYCWAEVSRAVHRILVHHTPTTTTTHTPCINMRQSYIDPEPENDPARRQLDDLELPCDGFGAVHDGGELDAPHEVGNHDDQRREGSADGAEGVVLQYEVEKNHRHKAEPRGYGGWCGR